MQERFLNGLMMQQKLPYMKTKTIFFITIITAIAILVVVQLNNKKSQTIMTSAAPPITITPIQLETFDVMDSPDGSKTLTLEKKGQFQTIFTSSKADGQKTQIYKEEALGSNKLEIPYNTWSPDNVYFFLSEKTPAYNNYFVFQSTGNLFPNNLPYVSIHELFSKNTPDYLIEDVTGWGGINLIILV
mgnify:CR=1 FL=1